MALHRVVSRDHFVTFFGTVRSTVAAKSVFLLWSSRETKKCVFVKGWNNTERRELKNSEYSGYFDSWEEAQAFLIARAQKKVASLEASFNFAMENLKEIENLKPEDNND